MLASTYMFRMIYIVVNIPIKNSCLIECESDEHALYHRYGDAISIKQNPVRINTYPYNLVQRLFKFNGDCSGVGMHNK